MIKLYILRIKYLCLIGNRNGELFINKRLEKNNRNGNRIIWNF
jgi:hypothetical protein